MSLMEETRETTYRMLKDWALDKGVTLFGVADIRPFREDFLHLSQQVLHTFDSGISLAVRLSDAILGDIKDRPTQLYFHHYRQANFFLDRVSFLLAQFIQEQGYGALPIPASQIIDWEHQKAHLSHKKIALEAGLGWVGRNNLLVNPAYGAHIRLATILTDLPLKHDHAIEDGCHDCTACLTVCPAGAIKERQEDFEHLVCFEQLRLFMKRDHIGQYICGVCVRACRGKQAVYSSQSTVKSLT